MSDGSAYLCRVGRRRPRGRVVMLVDNGVKGDSRVQKAARSAAAAGWDVVLLGKAPGRRRVTWRLGDAEVRLIPVRGLLWRPRYEARRAVLRNPLAYPPGPHAAYRRQRVKAWRTDLYHHHLALGLAARPGGASRVLARAGQAALFVLRCYVRALGAWVALRARQTDALQRKRAAMDAPLDRFTTWFWRTVMGDRCWRRFDPHLWDHEVAYGWVIDELRPDLIHAHDFRMIGVGARAALRARARGHPAKLVWDAHEFLPGIKPYSDHPRWHPAQCAYEREYVPYADAVVTVSETLADLLVAEYGLPERPAVVLNAPETARDHDGPTSDLRELCGIGPDVPLVVYSGSVGPERGLDIMVEALPWLEEVHVAFVVGRPNAPYMRRLRRRAAGLGVGDRVHVVPYVPYDEVVPFIAAADAGVISFLHYPNHEIALNTKFFEYSHARLPLVVSDVRTIAAATRSTGQGEVFAAGNVDDFVRAVRAVLAAPERYRAAYETPGLLEGWTWEVQADILDGVYTRLRPDLPPRPAPVAPADGPDVSVVVAVYNSMPYLDACMTSLVQQTIGLDRMEIIAVDDGSGDGSGKELDRYAELYPGVVRVIHQSNSGGPAGPYNRALDAATGRYVYFVGSDDYLGVEALDRLVAAADHYGSDVVAGKMVGAGGRRIHPALYATSDPDVSLYDSALPWTLNNCKLFRRELIERHGVRYPEDMPVGADQHFTFEACLHAKRISVLADYNYYYAVRRADDGNITYRTTCTGRLACAAKLIEFKASRIEPGPRRDKLLRVHFRWELASLLGPDFLDLDRDTQEHVCESIGRLADRHLTAAIKDGLDTGRRTRLCLAQQGAVDTLCAVIREDAAAGGAPPIVVTAEAAFARYPGFRDKRTSIPDECYRITADLPSRIAGVVETSSVRWDRDEAGRQVLSVGARAALAGAGALDPDVVQVVIVPLSGGTKGAGARRRTGHGHGHPVAVPAPWVTREPAADGTGIDIHALIPLDSLVAAYRAGVGVGAGAGWRRLAVRLQVMVAGEAHTAPLAAGGPVAAARTWRRGRLYRFRPKGGEHGPLVIVVAPLRPTRSVTYRLRRLVTAAMARSGRPSGHGTPDGRAERRRRP
ncbi:MAG TPA: glycosyltransferase [Streptosporangiaceae bacterium]|nr:glycosyltransferase [Streptosporangiaceae bacterium]